MDDLEASRNARTGLWLGIISAIGYSAANVALRDLSARHADMAWDVWVSAMKAVPTLVIALIMLVAMRHRRRSTATTDSKQTARSTILPLIGAALIMQFGGNLGFQVAIGHIGLAITVPLVFAFIILAGAVLGRIFLGDTVSMRLAGAILLMTISIVVLSCAARENAENESTGTNSESTEVSGTQHTIDSKGYSEARTAPTLPPPSLVWFGIIVAVASGVSYGLNGAVIRGVARDRLPVERMLMVYSATGVVCLGSIGGYMMGLDRLASIDVGDWGVMAAAGTFNAGAFFCVSYALKVMNISRVNVINASQNAMCAVAAVALFDEPLTQLLVIGIGLSIAGLVVLGK